MKNLLSIFFVFILCALVWFVTSFSLGGQAKQWFEQEPPQTVLELPEDSIDVESSEEDVIENETENVETEEDSKEVEENNQEESVQ